MTTFDLHHTTYAMHIVHVLGRNACAQQLHSFYTSFVQDINTSGAKSSWCGTLVNAGIIDTSRQLNKFAKRLLFADTPFVWIKGRCKEAAACTDDKQLIAF